MRVLVVEDDSTAARSIEKMLRSKGHEPQTTSYGMEAVELASSNDYDIILLDIMLPDIDGYEVLRQLHATGVRTPILFQSGLIGCEQFGDETGIGIEDFLIKPFDKNELIGRIESAAGRAETGAADPAPPPEDEFDRRHEPRDDDDDHRREHPRVRTLKSGKIIYRNSNCIADCLILNMSDGGAALQAADFTEFPKTFLLEITNGPTYRCEICWQQGRKLGVRFLNA
jgi:DNA-binding response OmpR family regulator